MSAKSRKRVNAANAEHASGFYRGVAFVLADLVRSYDKPAIVREFLDRHCMSVTAFERHGATATDIHAVQTAVCGGGRADLAPEARR